MASRTVDTRKMINRSDGTPSTKPIERPAYDDTAKRIELRLVAIEMELHELLMRIAKIERRSGP